jgi:hypothetical protein
VRRPRRPDPAGPDDRDNAQVFERSVRLDNGDGTHSTGRIDLFKRGCFVLEAKQGSAAEDTAQPMLSAFNPEEEGHGDPRHERLGRGDGAGPRAGGPIHSFESNR